MSWQKGQKIRFSYKGFGLAGIVLLVKMGGGAKVKVTDVPGGQDVVHVGDVLDI